MIKELNAPVSIKSHQINNDNPYQTNNKIIMKIGKIAKFIFGLICEFLSSIVLRLLYCVRQRKFDPIGNDIEKNANGIAIQQPILLVHGYLHNSSAWAYYRKMLNKAGFKNVFTVDLGAFPNKSIEQYANILADRIKNIYHETKRNDIAIVGHSMGGLVSSYYALYLAKEVEMTVTDVITLNSPLRGTVMHRFGIGPCVKQMALDSQLVKKISNDISKTKIIRYFHIASDLDFIVQPQFSPLNKTDEKENDETDSHKRLILKKNSHNSILRSKKATEEIINFLNINSVCHLSEKLDLYRGADTR